MKKEADKKEPEYDIDQTFATLERHYRNLSNGINEIMSLVACYKKRNRRRTLMELQIRPVVRCTSEEHW